MGVVKEQVAEATAAFGSVFANRDLRRVNLALAGSVIGDWAYGIAVAVWAFDQGGATAVGLFGVIRLACLALISPVASSLADRYERKRVMIVSDVLRAVLVTVGAVLVAGDAPDLAVYAVALSVTVSGSAFRPAQASLIPMLADSPSELTNANVVASTIESVAFFVGPALAALLLASTGLWVVFALNAATFAWSAVMIAGVATRHRGSEVVEEIQEEHSDEADGGVLAGFATIARDRNLRTVAALYGAQTVVAGALLVFEVVIVFDLLERGEAALGGVNAVLGVGGLLGGVVAVLLARRERMALDFGVSVLGWAAPLLLIAAVPSMWSVVVAYVVIGISNSLVDITASTIFQRIAPDAVMGRVFGALEAIIIGSMALGSLAAPLLIKAVDTRVSLAIVGGLVAALAILSIRTLDRIDETVLAPPGLRLLSQVPMLSVLARPVQERLAAALEPRTVPAGEVVFREGDAGDHFWIVRSGAVSVTADGKLLAELGPGEGFGEIALLRDVPRMATVTALGDVELLGLVREEFVLAMTATDESRSAADTVVNRYLSLA